MAYRIFLTDDDRFLLDLYAVKFKNAGHEVNTFSSGEDLLTTLRKKDEKVPDAILIDLIMPGMGGFETIATIRKEGLVKTTKIIILSNQGQDSDIWALENGYISVVPSMHDLTNYKALPALKGMEIIMK